MRLASLGRMHRLIYGAAKQRERRTNKRCWLSHRPAARTRLNYMLYRRVCVCACVCMRCLPSNLEEEEEARDKGSLKRK